MTRNADPQLAPPGAGLPEVERIVARAVLAIQCLTGNRRSFDKRIASERDSILELVGSVNAQAGSQRVLIRRLPGMEDSSRNWSIFMTLDHLRIVNLELARVIGALTRGVVPDGEASTAAVKPSVEAGLEVVAAFDQSCTDLLAEVRAANDLKTAVRYLHPWFGPLDAANWHALAGIHLGIHRTQIIRILAGLSDDIRSRAAA